MESITTTNYLLWRITYEELLRGTYHQVVVETSMENVGMLVGTMVTPCQRGQKGLEDKTKFHLPFFTDMDGENIGHLSLQRRMKNLCTAEKPNINTTSNRQQNYIG